MKDELKNKKGKEIPNPDDFWPEAKELLDKHYAAKKKILIFWRWTFVALTFSCVSFFAAKYGYKNEQKLSLQGNNAAIKIKEDASILNMAETEKETTKNTNLSEEKISRNNLVLDENKNNFNEKRTTNRPATVSNKKVKFENKTLNPTVNKSISENVLTKQSSPKINIEITNLVDSHVDGKKENRNDITNNQLETSFHQENEDLNQNIVKKSIVDFKLLQLSFINQNLESEKEIFRFIDVKQNNISSDEYAKLAKKISYAISVYSGLQAIHKTIQPTTQFQEYAARRSNEENAAMTSFHGVNINLKRKHILVSAGFQYNTFSEINNYKAVSKQWQVSDLSKWNSTTKQVLVVDTFYYFGIRSYKSTLATVNDSSFQEQYDSSFVNTANNKILDANKKTRLTYVELPITFGYEFKVNKISIAPCAGVSFGYLTKKEGAYINRNLTGIESISSIKEIRNYMINYCFQLQIGYAVNRRIGIFIAPQYKANAISITKKSFGVDTFYKSFGGLLGMKFEL